MNFVVQALFLVLLVAVGSHGMKEDQPQTIPRIESWRTSYVLSDSDCSNFAERQAHDSSIMNAASLAYSAFNLMHPPLLNNLGPSFKINTGNSVAALEEEAALIVQSAKKLCIDRINSSASGVFEAFRHNVLSLLAKVNGSFKTNSRDSLRLYQLLQDHYQKFYVNAFFDGVYYSSYVKHGELVIKVVFIILENPARTSPFAANKSVTDSLDDDATSVTFSKAWKKTFETDFGSHMRQIMYYSALESFFSALKQVVVERPKLATTIRIVTVAELDNIAAYDFDQRARLAAKAMRYASTAASTTGEAFNLLMKSFYGFFVEDDFLSLYIECFLEQLKVLHSFARFPSVFAKALAHGYAGITARSALLQLLLNGLPKAATAFYQRVIKQMPSIVQPSLDEISLYVTNLLSRNMLMEELWINSILFLSQNCVPDYKMQSIIDYDIFSQQVELQHTSEFRKAMRQYASAVQSALHRSKVAGTFSPEIRRVYATETSKLLERTYNSRADTGFFYRLDSKTLLRQFLKEI